MITQEIILNCDAMFARMERAAENVKELKALQRRVEENIACGSLFGEDDPIASQIRRSEERAKLTAELIGEISEWIASLDDPIVQEILTARFLKGARWSTISRRMGYQSESGARMAAMREIAKLPKR